MTEFELSEYDGDDEQLLLYESPLELDQCTHTDTRAVSSVRR